MVKTKLEMDFLDALNKNFRISLDDPRVDLTEAEVTGVMGDIITAGVFQSKNGNLIEVAGARVVSTTVTEMEI